jgi:hypothetical protein
MNWVTIDFEASCLPRHGRSFPIEVAVSGPLGTTSWLIRPHAAWHDWDWTEEAFGLHGLRRADLDQHGLDAHRVLADLSQAIGTARVFADSPLDSHWLGILAQAALPAAAPGFRIDHVGAFFDEIGATHEQIMAAQQRAETLCPARHRAGADARWLRVLIENLLHQPAGPSWPREALPVAGPYPAPYPVQAAHWHAAA